VDEGYAQHYRELYQEHWWWRAREKVVLETISRYRPPDGWGSILDVGCGDGLFFDRLSELGEVEGVEPAAAALSPTSKHRDRIHVGPFDESFQPGKRYSLILMLDVLEHLDDPVHPLRHALSLLEPEGVFLATVPAFNLLWTNHDDLNHHFRRYTKAAFRELARRAELRIDQATYFSYWTCPAKLVSRVMEKVLRLQPAVPRLPPRWINDQLYALSRIEHSTLGMLPMPFGSSLMVVGGTSPAGKGT
jgi:SAM-dependent methyltransferase